MGNPGDIRPVGEDVSELRIDYGPGFRVYFARRGSSVAILLAGGENSAQNQDVGRARKLARSLWKAAAMTKTQTPAWDSADYLETDEDIVAYLEAAFDGGEPGTISAALGDIAKARGITKIAAQA